MLTPSIYTTILLLSLVTFISLSLLPLIIEKGWVLLLVAEAILITASYLLFIIHF